MRSLRHAVLFTTAAVAAAPHVTLAAEPLVEQAQDALRKAGRYWATKVASHGGFVWEYSTDLTTWRRGESDNLRASTVWVQPPGTPAVGAAFLRAYEATGERLYLDAAVAAAHCLARGQLASGGWSYRIDFDPSTNRYRYQHLDPKTTANYGRLRNTSTFDDNNTQSATRFLMAVDRYVDDPRITAAIDRALHCFLAAQYKDGLWQGAWPQRYPPPAVGYGRLPTFNDNTMSDCVRTMLAAYRQYQKPTYLAAVKRCLEFYLRSQLDKPQAAWAQQYDEQLRPAPARRFEPAAVSGLESSGNMQLLLDLYLELGDPRYLDAVGRAVAWYRHSRIGGTPRHGVWARFYEVGTNRPLYFTRTYQLVYTDDDLPVHYSFQGNYGVDQRIALYQAIRKRGRNDFLAERNKKPARDTWARRAEQAVGAIRKIIAQQDEQGRWVHVVAKREQVRDAQGRVGYEVDEKIKIPMIYSREFIKNMTALANYVTAARGGPAVEPH